MAQRRSALLLPGSLLVLAACATITNVPPITTADASSHREGEFVWYDLLTEDLAQAERFYGELLGWTFTETDVPGYSLIEHGGRPIGIVYGSCIVFRLHQ